jgi:hypothetical protein
VWGRAEVYARVRWENLSERDGLKDPGVVGTININTDLQVVGCEDMDWIDLAQDRNKWKARSNELSGSIKRGEFLD